jgi:hypothetical protein
LISLYSSQVNGCSHKTSLDASFSERLHRRVSTYNTGVYSIQNQTRIFNPRANDRRGPFWLRQIIRQAFLLVLPGLVSNIALAQTGVGQPQSPIKIERRAILEFSYEPEEGILEAHALTPNGADAFPLENFAVSALADRLEQGRVEHTSVTRLDDSGFRAQLGLAQDTGWNLQFEVIAGGETLKGSYLLQVTQATTRGRLALTRPPTKEISRLSLLTSLLVGIPLGLTAIVVVYTHFRRAQLAAEP